MELEIYNPTKENTVKQIDWNFEELKKEITEKAEMYGSLVYTDENIKEAKADIAKLNKFIKVLEDKRKDVKKMMLEPYTQFESLEEALNTYPGIPMEKLCAFLEVSAKSPQKKLNMFLRWMIRRDSAVDLGIWESFDRRDLIVPLDTHVCRVAHYFKLTDAETFSLKNARQITAALAEVFPDDPCLGDFALFGLGVNGEI